MFSGSYFTNLVDGICNLLICWYAAYASGQAKSIDYILVHGDDVVIVSSAVLNANELNKWIESIGMSVKMEDSHAYSSAEDKVHFLGSEWICGVPHRSIIRMSLSACQFKSA